MMQGLFSISALSLLAVNLGVIAFAVQDDWSLATILMSYWVQSILIGLFQALKIADLKTFSTEGFKMGGHAVDPTPATKIKVVAFFLVHYGIFHFVYFGFIRSEAGAPDWFDVAMSGLAFFANHLLSFVMNRRQLRARVPNIGTMMFFPYIRIVPMHVFLVFGAFAAGPHFALVFFLLLKTLADMAMHALEHRGEGLA